jgi:predicted solute-binding protein
VVALRLGVVSYLNVEPIIHGVKGDPRFQIVPAVPSRVAEMLHAGVVDLGVIPSVEYASGDYAIVPGIGIASRGAVGSVCLFHSVPVEKIRRVALDTSSRTSVALCRLWLRSRLGTEPEYVAMPPPLEGMLAAADAALLIGDPALFHDGDEPRIDLGEEWTRMTGLPFVYAFWAGRPGAATAEQVGMLQDSLRGGLQALPSIAAAYNGLGAGRAALSEAYLRERIVYTLGEPETEGLLEFYRRALALGLVPRVPELRFYGRS